MIRSLDPTRVVVVGAGPAGLAFAVALARAGVPSTVLEAQPRGALEHPPEDGRDIALTHRARRVLESLGLWQRLPANEIAPLRRAQVRDGVSPWVLPFDASSDGFDELGWLVPNHRLREAAYAAACDENGITLVGDARVTALARDRDTARVDVQRGASHAGALVVAADSRFSGVRRLAGIGAQTLDFGRTAIAARVTHELDHRGTAHEMFRYGNTLALLPMAGRQVSAVVTVPADAAAEWLALDDDAFVARVQSQSGNALGAMRPAGTRHAYPLVAVYAQRFVAPRFALLGDAAVGMHPVTAHGYNFGLYGVELLARELAAARRAGRDLGQLSVLMPYEDEHRRTTRPIYLGTNAIVRLFTDERAPARLLRGAVLRAAGHLPPLQRAIARQLTGRSSLSAGELRTCE
jgi:ubiquinone biosynthesis UbiH/UbiF/VisC/COQ6 family hydroxylase